MISNLVTSVRILLLAPLLILLSQPGDEARWTALGLFLLAGLTDVIDGRLARALNEVSRLGAMLDLIADRLLTLAVLIGLAAASELRGVYLLAGVILIARDLVVASFGEAAPGLGIVVTPFEKVKVTLQILAFGLLIAPDAVRLGGVGQHELGRYALSLSALLACITVAQYAGRTAPRLNAT